ncbi:MAG: putative DNA binding domain-containing protein [Thiomicrorhabdus sp.]|nr:putative DNA binding domain-containing protein [Thiomicrorhabdus sp.]
MNSHSDLITLIAQGETENIEFKTSFQKEVFESLVAFANAKGGRVILGVSDAQKILGLQVGVETLSNWQNQVKNATYPSLIPEMDVFELEGKTLVVITVDEQPIKPIAYKQRYFKQIRNANHLMSLDEVANEHLKTLNASWDYYIDTRHDFSDISMDKVARFIEAIEQHQNKKFSEDPYTILSKYELIKEQQLSFGAYLLFVNNFSAITSLQIGRFKSETTIIDNIDINTDLPNQVERSLAFIRKHLMVEFIITGQAQRTERFDYPLEAIREVVINMIVHRDYRDSGTSIIKIFDDRIECFNPGKLYGDLTVKQLTSGDYVSKVRNRAITNMFKEAGIIERYGSGIKRIQQSCLTHGVVEPKLEKFQHGFRVTLYKERLEKLELQINLSEKTRDYNIGTSLRNYIDPRVFKAWTDEVGAEWEKLYTAALQKKFLWVKSEKLSWSGIAKQ